MRPRNQNRGGATDAASLRRRKPRPRKVPKRGVIASASLKQPKHSRKKAARSPKQRGLMHQQCVREKQRHKTKKRNSHSREHRRRERTQQSNPVGNNALNQQQ